MLNELVRMGLDGLETEYPAFSLPEKSFLNGLAADYQLFTTAGKIFTVPQAETGWGWRQLKTPFLIDPNADKVREDHHDHGSQSTSSDGDGRCPLTHREAAAIR